VTNKGGINNMQEKQTSTKVITGLVRFSYLQVFTPKTINNQGDPKYSVSLIIPKSDKATIRAIKQAIKLAADEGLQSKFGGKIPAGLKTPLRDGDVDRPEDEAYANSMFINCSSPAKNKPGVIDKNLKPILDESEVYSGAYGRASVTFFPYNAGGNKGIGAGLNHLQKLKDGEQLGSVTSAEEDFKDIDLAEELLDDDEDY